MAINQEALTTTKSTSTYCIACKMPNGLILRLFEWVEREVPVMGGGMRLVRQARETGARVTINGPAHPFGVSPLAKVVGGYALTYNVPAEFFDKWMEQNHDTDLVKNKIIFAQPTIDRVEAQAYEQRTVRSGMEPLARDTSGEMVDERVPRPINPLINAITTAVPGAS